MATIKDVAKLAGVSYSTVSRAFSGKIFVEPATRKRIFEAAEELAYSPNRVARTLKDGRSNTIALVIPGFENDIWPEIAFGIEQEALKNGFLVVFCSTQESIQKEKGYIERLKGYSVDGFIIAPAMDNTESVQILKNYGIPVVQVLRGKRGIADIVHMNNYDVAYKATQFLLQNNHNKILMVIGDTRIGLFQDRLEGYRAAIADYGMQVDEELVISSGNGMLDVYERVSNVLKKRDDVDAVFTSSDPQAVCAIRAVKDLGYSIPEDVSVIGIDDIPISEMLDPPLTTIGQPFREIGRSAARQLFRRIEAKNKGEYVDQTFQWELHIRQSTRGAINSGIEN